MEWREHLKLTDIKRMRICYQKKANACWEHNYVGTKEGYARFYIYNKKGNRTRKSVALHRLFYYLYNGDFNDNLLVCHTCDNPKCINPAHLFLGTHADNAKDKKVKNRARNGHTNKTHCKRGHEFTNKNTRYRNNGKWRICITCQDIRNARRNYA